MPEKEIEEWPEGVERIPSIKRGIPSGEVHTSMPTNWFLGVPSFGPQRARKSGRGRAIQFFKISVTVPEIAKESNSPNIDTWIR